MAGPVMKGVYSSHVDRIGYDAEAQDLHVTWQGGRTSIYSGVPPEKADSVMNAWSVGQALHEEVKPHHSHRYVE